MKEARLVLENNLFVGIRHMAEWFAINLFLYLEGESTVTFENVDHFGYGEFI